MEQELVSGTIAAVVFENPENGYAVVKLDSDDGGLITVVGTIPAPAAGERLIVTGKWTAHATYGRQLEAEFLERLLPDSTAEIRAYLSSRAVRGVGPKTAEKIVAAFGTDSLKILETAPERLTEIDGISRKKALEIGASFRQQVAVRRLIEFLAGYRIPAQVAVRLYRVYGAQSLERVQEESYFFKLSAFQDKLLKLYDEHPDFVEPAFRMNEVRSFVEGGLNDLSVSRTSFDWGIQVPFDEGHVTYVWFDALLNYMTAVGYGVDTDEARAELAYRWPAQFHIVGKDIIRFHCVIWPAMLMAIGEALPEHVFAHGFLTVRNAETGKAEKMSKSRGNAIAPQDVIDMLGVEGYRYYFMTDVVPGTDGAISFERMEQVYNADLANSWGNLISRSLNMSGKYFDGCAPAKPASFDAFDNPLAKIADGLVERYMAKMDVLDYGGAKDEVMELIHAANHYIEDSEPWALAKDEAKADELAFVIYNLLEAIRIAAHLLMPLMPQTSAEALRRLSCADEAASDDLKGICAWGLLAGGQPVEKGDPLFPRLG